MEPLTLIFFLAVAAVFLFIFLYFVPINLWITAIFSGVKIEIFDLVFMRIRKTPPQLIVQNLIRLTKAGVPVKTSDLETHYLTGGNVDNVTRGLIRAKISGQTLSWLEATALDLKGTDLEDYVKKRKLESDGGIDHLREQLSNAILQDLDTDQVKEVARVIESMKPIT